MLDRTAANAVMSGLLAFVACADPPQPAIVTSEEEVTPVKAESGGPRPPPLPVGGREITLKSSEATPIREVTLEVPADAKEYTLRKAKGGRVIFEGPHLVLVGGGPIAPGRFLVRVKASEDDYAETVAVHLVDIDRGSIAKFDGADGWQAPKFGLATVYRNTPVGREWFLLHASDGHAVSLDAQYIGTLTDVEIHPGRGDGWVFTHDQATQTTKVAHWTDLRKAPPMATQEFPIFALDDKAVNNNEWSTTHLDMPSTRNPVDTDPIVSAPEWWEMFQKCRRVALHRDGTFDCANYDFELGEGWFGAREDDRFFLFNKKTTEIQRIVLDDDCASEVTWFIETLVTPPRAMLRCGGLPRYLLWSPGLLERVELRLPAGEEFEAETNTTETVHARGLRHTGHSVYTNWVDLRGRTLVQTPELGVVRRRWDRTVAVTTAVGDAALAILGFDPPTLTLVRRRPCIAIDEEGWSRTLFGITCEGANQQPRYHEVVDVNARSASRLPAPHGEWYARVLVDDQRRQVVMVQRHGSGDTLVVWALAPESALR